MRHTSAELKRLSREHLIVHWCEFVGWIAHIRDIDAILFFTCAQWDGYGADGNIFNCYGDCDSSFHDFAVWHYQDVFWICQKAGIINRNDVLRIY